MRQVYRLLKLARRYGAATVDASCPRALEFDVVSVAKITSMLERAAEHQPLPAPAATAANRTSDASPGKRQQPIRDGTRPTADTGQVLAILSQGSVRADHRWSWPRTSSREGKPGAGPASRSSREGRGTKR